MSGPGRRNAALILCGLLCMVFAVVSWRANRGKSATWDEPSHALTGWLMLYRQDYRLSPDVPPLWEKWIALASSPTAIRFDPKSAQYTDFSVRRRTLSWAIQTLYRTSGNDGLQLVNRARAMALIVGILLAVLIARWAWELAGPAAAVIATFLFCLDPNFLGHSSLAKNDVAISLSYAAAAYAIFRAGRKLTWLNAAAVAGLIAVAILVKFSGILLIPVLMPALFIRIFSSTPWIVGNRILAQRRQKLIVAALLCVATAIVCYASLWAAYGFRFDAGPNGLTLDMSVVINRLRDHQRVGTNAATQDATHWQPPFSTRAVLFGERHHLLPQAWAYGFIFVQGGDEGVRGGYLLGENYKGGKWYYFPLAALFKSPLAMIFAAILAAAIGIRALTGRKAFRAGFESRWATITLVLPAAVYAIAAMTAQINIGLRHVFPVFPFVFIGMSVALVWLWQGKGKWILILLALLMAAEDTAAFPNYIAFFNFAAAPHRLQLLADSNLDWGQDLPLLAAWQREYPKVPLYFQYFGQCDPAAYGIRYLNVTDGYPFGPPPQSPGVSGVLALSATDMQYEFFADQNRWKIWGLSSQSRPEKILGGTIYLFAVNPPGRVEKK